MVMVMVMVMAWSYCSTWRGWCPIGTCHLISPPPLNPLNRIIIKPKVKGNSCSSSLLSSSSSSSNSKSKPTRPHSSYLSSFPIQVFTVAFAFACSISTRTSTQSYTYFTGVLLAVSVWCWLRCCRPRPIIPTAL